MKCHLRQAFPNLQTRCYETLLVYSGYSSNRRRVPTVHEQTNRPTAYCHR